MQWQQISGHTNIMNALIQMLLQYTPGSFCRAEVHECYGPMLQGSEGRFAVFQYKNHLKALDISQQSLWISVQNG